MLFLYGEINECVSWYNVITWCNVYNFEESTSSVESLAKNLVIPYLFCTLWFLRVFIMELEAHISYASNVFFLEQNKLGSLTKKPIYNFSS